MSVPAHACVRPSSPFLNNAYLGSRGEVPRPDRNWSSQYRTWEWKGREFGAGESKEMEITVVLGANGTGDMPGVVWMDDALRASVLRMGAG